MMIVVLATQPLSNTRLVWLWPGTPGVYKWGIATQVGNYENLNKMVTVRNWGVASRVPRISSLSR